MVEQTCVFLDIDGRDTEPSAEHLWVRDDAGVAGAARILDEGAGTWSIGRVVTRADVRHHGIASALVTAAVDRLDRRGARSIVLGAQSHLAGWYERFGFTVSGPEYVEDGIPHVPMRREPRA